MIIRKKCICFDMDTHTMSGTYHNPSWRNGYSDIGKFLNRYGFTEHKQGSLYETDKKMTDKEALFILDALCKEYPWFTESAKKAEIYDKRQSISAQAVLDENKEILKKQREKLQKEVIEKFKANKAPENSAKSTDKER